MRQAETTAIMVALAHCNGNREQAAKVLQIGERTIYRKIKEYDI
jgi:DNA-binding NtrC family response regulator